MHVRESIFDFIQDEKKKKVSQNIEIIAKDERQNHGWPDYKMLTDHKFDTMIEI